MKNRRDPRSRILFAFQFLPLIMQIQLIFCEEYKVGDLDAWGIPTSANPLVYNSWSKFHVFKIGDQLCRPCNHNFWNDYFLITIWVTSDSFAVFLYPPSQDSVVQVTEDKYNTCNVTEPILYMNNGNSLFNITNHGEIYFTSGAPGNCEKNQKLHVSVLPPNGSVLSPSNVTPPSPETSPSYPTVFGAIPHPPSSYPSSSASPYSSSSSPRNNLLGFSSSIFSGAFPVCGVSIFFII